MDSEHREDVKDGQMTEKRRSGGRILSRREFLKKAGIAGAAVGVGGGLVGLASGCGEEETTTTTAGATTTTGGPTTTAAASTTTVNAAEEMGREIKVGYVTPVTGALANFGIPDAYCIERWREWIGDGIVCGDGQKHPVTILDRDSQSDTNRAAQVAGDLINNDQVDIIMASSSPDVVNPVADQAEAAGQPCITVDAPMEAYFFGRGGDPAVGFKWTYHVFWGFEPVIVNNFGMYKQLETNKVVGALWPNNVDGNAFRDGFTPGFNDLDYTLIDPGGYPEPLEDFTAMISTFKKEGCEIIVGCMIPPDFANFWSQTHQQGLVPKICDVSKPALFPSGVEALGDLGEGLISGCWWHPAYPFTSSLTGETCQQLADDFEKRTGYQWTQPILHYVVFELAADVLKRAENLDDKETIIKAVSSINLADSVAGPIDFTAPVAPSTPHSVPNVVATPVYGGQWVKGTEHMYELMIICNEAAPMLPLQGELQPIPGSV